MGKNVEHAQLLSEVRIWSESSSMSMSTLLVQAAKADGFHETELKDRLV